MSHFLIFSLLLLSPFPSLADQSPELYRLYPSEQGYLVPEVLAENLPQPVYYEGYIPVILEFQTPKWNKSDVTFNNWYSCVSETFPYKYSCPVSFHMNKVVGNLHLDFEEIHPAIPANKEKVAKADTALLRKLTGTGDFCSRIQTHFPSPFLEKRGMEDYIEALKNCRIRGWNWSPLGDVGMIGKVYEERNISNFNYSVRVPYTKMENNFYTTFYKNIVTPSNLTRSDLTQGNSSTPATPSNPKIDLLGSGLLSNFRATLQATTLAQYYAEKNRWVHANTDCINGLIPHSLISNTRLAEILDRIESTSAFKERNELSIPSDRLSKYFGTKIADCAHTEEGMMVVRLQIPYLRKTRSRSLQLIHTTSLPFEYHGHVCKIKAGDHGGGSGFYQERSHANHFLYDEFSGYAFGTDCKGGELCPISEYALKQRTNTDRCVTALMKRNYSAIKGYCQLQCRKQDLKDFPIVSRIRGNQYVITGSPVDIIFNCEGNGKRKIWKGTIPEARIGANLVNVPCGCVMTLHSSAKMEDLEFFGEGACVKTNSSDAEEDVDSIPYGGDVVDGPEIVPLLPYHFIRSRSDRHSTHSESPFFLENVKNPESERVNLADFIDLEKIELLLQTVESSKGGKHVNWKGEKWEPELTATATHTPLVDNGCPTLTSLWVVFVIFALIVGGVQGYLFYLIRRTRLNSGRDDQRILYKVTDSPGMY